MTPESIVDGTVVSFHYTLTNDEGETLESSLGKTPLAYLHGAGNIVAGLETALTGRVAGDKVTVAVEPADGYGERDDRGVLKFTRDRFPADAPLEAGMQFGAQGPDGQTYPAWIVEVDGDSVTIDFNHPLAGVRLRFEVQVETLREATAAEVEQGRPSGGHP